MSKYKLLLLDMDGTIVASKADAMPSPRVVQAVKKAQQHVHVAMTTGRPKSFADPVIDVLGISGPSVFNGGAEVIDITTGELLYRQQLSVESILEVAVIAQSFGVSVYTDKRDYDIAVIDSNKIIEETAKLFIGHVQTEKAIHLVEELMAVKDVAAHMTTSWGDGDIVDIHVVHEHATKRYGAEKLMAILGIIKEEVIAIGDGYNDLPMLEAAGFKVAMGNAPDEVKAMADHIAPTLVDDGVADTIEKFILSGQ